MGNVTHPTVLNNGLTATPYPLNNYPPNVLLRPRLNASGSLYYWAFPNFFEIFDVPTGMLRLRFSLAQIVQNVETPIAIDQGGRPIFLITNAGLTVVDLGIAPLSVGHLSSSTVSAGADIKVRGSGFASSTRLLLEGSPQQLIVPMKTLLQITIPALSSGIQDLALTAKGWSRLSQCRHGRHNSWNVHHQRDGQLGCHHRDRNCHGDGAVGGRRLRMTITDKISVPWLRISRSQGAHRDCRPRTRLPLEPP